MLRWSINIDGSLTIVEEVPSTPIVSEEQQPIKRKMVKKVRRSKRIAARNRERARKMQPTRRSARIAAMKK